MAKIDEIRAQLKAQFPKLPVDMASDYQVAEFVRQKFYAKDTPEQFWNSIGMRNPDRGAASALAGGIISGLPLVGPPLKAGLEEGIAQLEHGLYGRPLKEVRDRIALQDETMNRERPKMTGGGKLAGGVMGLLLVAQAAPSLLFGAPEAGMATQVSRGALSQGLIGAGQNAEEQVIKDRPAGDVIRSPGSVDPVEVAQAGARGAATGAVAGPVGDLIGMAAGSAGRAAYKATHRPPTGVSRGAAKVLEPALAADADVAPVVSDLQRFGPDAKLIDAGPSTMQVGQGVSAVPGEPRSVIFKALNDREAGAPARIQSALDNNFGAETAPQTTVEILKGLRRAEGQMLQPVYKNAGPVDVQAVVDAIDKALGPGGAVGPEAVALRTIRRHFLTAGPIGPNGQRMLVLKSNAPHLQKVKEVIDDLINYGSQPMGLTSSASQRSEGALKMVRGLLNDEMRNQVPGYGDVMDRMSLASKVIEEYNKGLNDEVLAGGKGAVHPRDFKAGWDQLPPDLQEALRYGTRADIERILYGGQSSNPRLGLNRLIGGGEPAWRRSKLETVFGQGPAEQVAQAAEREKRFFDTKSKVVDNSQTDARAAGRDALAPTAKEGVGPAISFGVGGLPGVAGYGVAKAAGKGISGVVNAGRRARNLSVAEALTARDPASLAEALIERYQGTSAAGQTAGRFGQDLVRALAGGEAIDRENKDVPPWQSVVGGVGNLVNWLTQFGGHGGRPDDGGYTP